MSYRRRHRWFRRMALGLAFASVMFAGRASVAAAKIDPGTGGSRYVVAGGWSGEVDPQSGIPISAGIPQGDEQFIDTTGRAGDPVPLARDPDAGSRRTPPPRRRSTTRT